ncbi:MAG: hypothetical protein ABSA16_09730 [Thermoguttaceae bacterium]|jgi:hypothetical protein
MRIATWIYSGFICFIMLSEGRIFAQAVPPGEYLLPDTTRGFLAITNVDTLNEHYNNTQLGKLTADPKMEEFTKDVRRQFDKRWSAVHARLGLTLDDLKEVSGGEVCVALIEPVENTSALAIVIDATGKLPQAHELMDRVKKNLTEQGGKRTVLKVDECPDPVIQFEMPIPPEEQDAASSNLPAAGATESKSAVAAKDKPKPRISYYVLTGNMLGAADNLDVMQGILSRLAGKKGGTLSEVEGFKKVLERCKTDIPGVTPQIRWFMYPLGYAAAARAAQPPEQRRKGKSILEVMRNQGVGAIQGIGGYASFSTEGFDLVHRTTVYAPLPYKNAMKMLVLLNGKDYTPQKWVPREIATYSTLYFDVLNAFDNFGPLFDELYGSGDSGEWADVLRQEKDDPNGPRIDLREELFKKLGQRVSMLTDYELPITTTSERLLFAIESTDDVAVAKALQKWFGNDPTAKRREIDGHVIWEIVENEGPEMETPEVSLGDVPDLVPQAKRKKTNQQNIMPHAAATVFDGNLFIASHLDFLLKVLRSNDPLVKDVDYQLVCETINQMIPQDKCARIFSRTDEEYRTTYEMIKQNKMPESESMFAQFLNALFGEGKKGAARQPKIDGSKLPDYEVARHYLSPAGMQITAEKDGWFLKGFTLNMTAIKGQQTVQSSQSSAPQTTGEPQTKPASQNISAPKTPAETKTPMGQPTSADLSTPPAPKTQPEPQVQAELQSKQAENSTVK